MPFSLYEVANSIKVAYFTLFLYMSQWKETKVAKIKTANLPHKLESVTLFTS